MSADKPRVGIARAATISGSPYEFDAASIQEVKTLVQEAISRACSLAGLVRKKKVLVKPNLVRPNIAGSYAVITDPRVILATALLVREAGAARVVVGENPGYGVRSRDAMDGAGVTALLREHGVEVCYLDEDVMIPSQSCRPRLLRKTLLPKTALECDVLVNIPKLKTHAQTVVSLGIKNLHGLLPDSERLQFHRQDIHQKLVDILAHRSPDLTIVDGIWAGEGQAPIFGSAIRDFNVVVAGRDVVAVDAVSAAIMGIHPEEVPMLVIAQAQGYGNGCLEEITVVGPQISEVQRRFRRAIMSSVGCFANVACYEGGACSGCLSNLRHSLDKLHKDGSLGVPGALTVFVGRPMPKSAPFQGWKGDLWLFGDCSAELTYEQPTGTSVVRRVPGCPPHIFDFAKLFEATYLHKEKARSPRIG